MLTQKHRCNLCLWLLVQVAYWKKIPEIGGECREKGIGLVEELFWRFSFSCQSVCVLFVVLSLQF